MSDAVATVTDMARVIFYTSTTLNGFLADDNDSLEWLFAVPGAAPDGIEDFLAGVGAIVQGSATYEWILTHEDLIAQPEKWPEYFGARPTWVFSSRALPSVPGADLRFAAGDIADEWPAIQKAAGDKDIWLVGGGDLVGQFADAGHLDELRISIAPVTLASGKPLLPRDLNSTRLRLESVRQAGQFAELVYSVTQTALS